MDPYKLVDEQDIKANHYSEDEHDSDEVMSSAKKSIKSNRN